MNPEKLKKLQAQAAQVRIGGKGTARRKKKVVHRTATTDDKKLQSVLKKLNTNNIPGVDQVNMIKGSDEVIHFANPKVQAAIAANTFCITGTAEIKQIPELLPDIIQQLGPESIEGLKALAEKMGAAPGAAAGDEPESDGEVPELVDNFDEAK